MVFALAVLFCCCVHLTPRAGSSAKIDAAGNTRENVELLVHVQQLVGTSSTISVLLLLLKNKIREIGGGEEGERNYSSSSPLPFCKRYHACLLNYDP